MNAIVRITEEARKIRRGRIEAVEDEARLMEAIARRQRATKEVLNGMKELKKDKDDQKKTRVDLLHEAEGMREDKCRDQETRVANRGSQGIQQRTRAREGESRLKERENLRRQQQGARQMSSPRSRGKIRSRERATRPRTGRDNGNRIPKKKSKWDQKPAQQSSAKRRKTTTADRNNGRGVYCDKPPKFGAGNYPPKGRQVQRHIVRQQERHLNEERKRFRQHHARMEKREKEAQKEGEEMELYVATEENNSEEHRQSCTGTSCILCACNG